jgi:ribosome-associated protein
MPRRMHPSQTPDPLPAGEEEASPSRSAVKRQAELAEKIGVELAKLSPEKLALIPIDDDTRDAIIEYQSITARGGGRRQRNYIGRLMRGVDITAVEAALAALQEGDREEARRFQQAEHWRGRLLVEEDALDALAQAHPGKDLTALAALVAKARREEERGGTMTHRRALFRAIRDALG